MQIKHYHFPLLIFTDLIQLESKVLTLNDKTNHARIMNTFFVKSTVFIKIWKTKITFSKARVLKLGLGDCNWKQTIHNATYQPVKTNSFCNFSLWWPSMKFRKLNLPHFQLLIFYCQLPSIWQVDESSNHWRKCRRKKMSQINWFCFNSL